MMKFLKILCFAALLLIIFIFSVSCDKEQPCKHKNIVKTQYTQTCDTEGYTENKCSECDFSFKSDIIPPTSHKYEKSVTSPSCEDEGYTTYSCGCGFSYKSDFVLPLSHKFTAVTTKPTCTEQGYTEYTCACGHKYTSDYLPPIGHKYTENVTPPTCAEQGYTTYTCDCGETYIGCMTPKSKHEYAKKTVSPSCTAGGYTTYTCVCGDIYNLDFTPPAGHNHTAVIIKPTCTTEGYTVYMCECGDTYKADITPATPHEFTSVGVDATCTEAGYMKYTCPCGHTYRDDFIPPRGHDFKLYDRIFPTLTRAGYKKYVCDCSYEYVGSYLFYKDITNGALVENTLPVSYGIDVSVYQHTVNSEGEYMPLDWNSIAESGVDFVILRAGTSKGKDPVFEMDYLGAKAAGLCVGAYFYTYALTLDEAKLDAHKMLMYIDGKQFDYPIYFDIEDPTQEALDRELLTKMTVSFFEILQERGFYTALYTNQKWLGQIFESDFILNTFDIWYARWPESAEGFIVGENEYPVWDTSYGKNYGMWQFTESGTVSGIDGIPVDINICYKDYPTIIKDLGLNGYGEPVLNQKEYVWVTANSLNVRSSGDFDADNVIGYLQYGQRIEVLERTDGYIKISYLGNDGYISAKPEYTSDTKPE